MEAKPFGDADGSLIIANFRRNLPEQRAHQIMVKGVLLIHTAKDAVPLIGLMHPVRRGPSTTNGFEPAHPNIDLGLEEDVAQAFPPIGWHNNVVSCFRPESDNQFLGKHARESRL